MELIESLDNPALYERKDHVAIFKPHKRTFPAFRKPDGTTEPEQVIEVTESDLPEIARNVNREYEQNGHLVKLTIGHRQQHPGYPETNQARVVGYARGYRAELVDRPGGKAIRLTHTEHIRKDAPEAIPVLQGQYPERSPEYHPDKKLITGVALLTREPHLHLGTVAYDDSSKPISYAMGTESMNPNEMVPPDDNDADNQGGDVDPVSYAAFLGCMKKYMAAMGPGNATMPAAAPPAAPYQGASRTVNYQNAPEFVALKNTVEELKMSAAAAQKRADTVECQRLLDPMTNVYSFNYESELATLINTPADQRQARINYMAENYRELPQNSFIRTADTANYQAEASRNVPEAFREPTGHAKAMQMIRSNPGMRYEDALSQAGK